MLRPVSLLAAVLLCSAAAAPAFAQNVSRDEVRPSVEEKSLYGAFLAGREAMTSGDSRGAAAFLIRAADARPDDKLLRERAFAAALVSGDVTAAARFAPNAETASLPMQGLGRLTMAAEALAAGRGAEADKILAEKPIGFPHHAASLLLKPWAAAAAGDWERAVAAHDAEGDRLVGILDQYTRAQLLESRKRWDEAETLYKALIADPVAASLFWLPYGEFLERRGREADAVAVYDSALASYRDEAVIAAKARAERKGRPPAAATVKSGAAQTLIYAAASMQAQRQNELALVYARLALRLDPAQDQGWVIVGDALSTAKDEPQAREAWARVPVSSRLWADAQTRTAYSLSRSGQVEAGVAALRQVLKTRPDDASVQLALADLLRTARQYPEAGQVLDALVEGPGANDWRVLYMRAATREKLGRWPEAEADLKRALELSPEEPELLNYLGYAWIDRGQNVTEGLALVERAVAARPNSGAMQDSLGWAQFRLGKYDKAVELLEAAVALEPADASVNDHLGDAYWMSGRQDEARFQWRRVLTLQPDAGLKTAVDAKLKDGLGPRAQVAGQ